MDTTEPVGQAARRPRPVRRWALRGRATTRAGTGRVVPDATEGDLRLVREAVAMVAIGGAPRVVLAGIHFDEAALDPARRLALEAGVRLRPLWHADGTGADIEVERIEA